MTANTISNRACFGAGCFWGTEQYLRVNFGEKIKPGSIKSGAVGFMSTAKSAGSPRLKLEEVCTSPTGFVEVFDFEFDGSEQTYEELVKHFYMFHDPTLLDKQGLDSGFKYSSAIFYYDDRQLAIAKRVTTELQALIDAGKIDSYSEKTVKTRLFPASDFYASEPDNQAYLERNIGSTCSALHAYRFRVWPTLS